MANVCTCEKGGKQGGVVLLRLLCLGTVENWEVVVWLEKRGVLKHSEVKVGWQLSMQTSQ